MDPRKGVASSTAPHPRAVPPIVQGKSRQEGGREDTNCKGERVAEKTKRRRAHPSLCLPRVPDPRAIPQSLGAHSEYVDRKEKSEPVFRGSHSQLLY